MKKKPAGVFSLIVTAFTGFGAHLLACAPPGAIACSRSRAQGAAGQEVAPA